MNPVDLNTISQEKKLFLDFQNESPDMFDYFFEKYYQGLCVYAYRMLKSKTEAEDLVQDFFVRILENRKNIQIISSVKSYFIRSIHNRCLDYIAHQKVISAHENYFLKTMTENEFQEYPLLDSELKAQIDQAIQNLPEGIRKTFLSSRYDSMSYHEIAAKENISVKTVEYRISKALGILRKDMGDYLVILFLINKF